jgi:hypothetical protein
MNHLLKYASIDIPFSRGLTWQQLGLGIVVITTLAVLVGLLVASIILRGPITTRQALSVIISPVTGIVAGLLLRSKWAMLLGLLIYGAAFELGRMDTSGPLVDMPGLGTTFGILVLLRGRGVHALLAGLPT